MDSSPKGKPVKRRKKSVGQTSRKKSVGQTSRKKSVGKKVLKMSVGKMRQLVHELSKDMDSAFDALNKWNKDELLEVLRVESGEKKQYKKLNKGPIINELLKIVSEEKDSSPTLTSNMSVDEKRQLVHELSKDSDSAFDALNKWNKEELLEVLCVESGENKECNELEKGEIINELLKIVSEEKDSSTSNMSVGEKRQLVHELSKDSDSAFDALNKWNKEELLEVLRLESGENKEYNELEKGEIINELLKFVSEEKDSSTTSKRDAKRQRKNVKPTRFSDSDKTKGIFYCQNLACQDTLRREDLFCKRCSCCICLKYDGNKDPSLWLTCDSDPPFPGESCGLTCHLDCAIEIEKSGLKEDPPSKDVDGCFYCVSCGKKNSLLECWKKQVLIAKETRFVEMLCFRLVMAQKLLKGTEKYRKLSETVDEAVKSLETELRGPLADLSSTMCRGIVNKLDSAPKVKELCSSALKSLQDIMLGDHALPLKMPEETSGGKQTSVEETKVSTKTSQEEEEGQEEATVVNILSTNGEEEQLALKETVPEKAVNKGKSSSSCGFGLEDCVKILRQLEFSGYVDTNFRQKFLTWYSLNASAQETNVVKTFVDVFEDDPVALAEQLIDSFSEHISRKRSATGGGNSSA